MSSGGPASSMSYAAVKDLAITFARHVFPKSLHRRPTISLSMIAFAANAPQPFSRSQRIRPLYVKG